ncbi:MAG: ketoacyl-ACP synthase III [Acidobacteria bacterium]|nr:ketoacyl-ACP synthase III [Acidobacteriota bacterium]
MQEKRVGILGLGKKLGSKVLTNKDLEKIVDTSDEWIQTRTGIKERRILDKGESAATLASAAAKEALENAGVKAEEIDLVVVTTITPEQPLPATAAFVQREIHADKAGAFDLVVACPGFVYALTVLSPLISIGKYKYILVVSCDTLSTITDWEDRGTCVLFADGAGAAVLGEVPAPRGILQSAIHNDPYNIELLEIPGGGSRRPYSHEVIDNKEHFVKMRGNELFKVAVKSMTDVSLEVLEKAGWTIDDVDLLVPHQANIRITDAVATRLKVDKEKAVISITYMGNNSSATIPATLYDIQKEGRLKENDIVLCTTFGSGVAYGALLIQW